jgi:hypothetical protein
MTLFVKLCCTEEGFFIPGSLPARDHNPLDLRHSPHSEHPGDPNAIGVIDNNADGFADAERQARLWADRGDTLQQAIYTEAPPGVDSNNAANYLAFVIAGFGGRVDADTPMSKVLEIQA